MSEPLVVAEELSRRFGEGATTTQAVRRASCTLHAGERIALVGPSGSGKSTLLNLLAGLDSPTAGSIRWPALGRREELRPAKVAMVFQGPSLLLPLSVEENVMFPVLLQGESEEEAHLRALTALSEFGIADLRDKLPEEISAGQAQRTAIARAVASRPALLLADEPTGQLDSATAVEVLTALLEVIDTLGVAAVIATHDPRVAARLDVLWEMNDGYLKTGAQCST
jgi:ABC-type lipoprotein export system ATPase subunit